VHEPSQAWKLASVPNSVAEQERFRVDDWYDGALITSTYVEILFLFLQARILEPLCNIGSSPPIVSVSFLVLNSRNRYRRSLRNVPANWWTSFQPQLRDYTAIPIPHVSASRVQVPAVPYPSVQQRTWQTRGLKAEVVPLQMDVRDDTLWFWMRSETSF
jgi:hypothetical protein